MSLIEIFAQISQHHRHELTPSRRPATLSTQGHKEPAQLARQAGVSARALKAHGVDATELSAIAGDEHIGGHILAHKSPRRHHDEVSDGHELMYGGVASKCDAISDLYMTSEADLIRENTTITELAVVADVAV